MQKRISAWELGGFGNFERTVSRQMGVAAALSLVICFSNARAQTTPAEQASAARQAEAIQRQLQEALEREQEARRGLNRAPSGMSTDGLLPKVDASAMGKICKPIKGVVISGAPNLPATLREQISSQFSNSCVGQAELEKILAEITTSYLGRGYITTRAYLNPLSTNASTLDIMVLEGKIQGIVVEDEGKNSILPLNAIPAKAGDLLNLRDLEQGVEQINRLSSNSAKFDIEPGDQPGFSTVVIRNAPTIPFHVSLSADNQGSESTGKHQVGLTLIADRLFGLNEMLVLTRRESAPSDMEKKASISDSFSLSVPFGYSIVSLSANRSTYVSTLALQSGRELKSDGRSDSDSARVDRVVYRDQTSRVSLSTGLTFKNSQNFLAGQFLEVSSRRLTVLDIGGSASTAFAGGVLSADVGLSKGLTLGSALVDQEGLPDFAPRAQFKKLSYSAGYSRGFELFGVGAGFSTQLTGQRAAHTLYGSEQISIGGIYSVRGFVRNTLSGDEGAYLRSEVFIRRPFNIGSQAISSRVYAAIDTGRVKGKVRGGVEGNLTGMALGVAFASRRVSLDLSYTRPLRYPSFFTREAPQFWVRLTVSA